MGIPKGYIERGKGKGRGVGKGNEEGKGEEEGEGEVNVWERGNKKKVGRRWGKGIFEGGQRKWMGYGGLREKGN